MISSEILPLFIAFYSLIEGKSRLLIAFLHLIRHKYEKTTYANTYLLTTVCALITANDRGSLGIVSVIFDNIVITGVFLFFLFLLKT